MRSAGISLVVLCVAMGCGGPPPHTAEMVTFEDSRNGNYAYAVAARSPQLAKDADAEYEKSVKAHEDGDADLALHHARLANMFWMTAVYQSQATDAENDANNSAKSYADSSKQLEAANAQRDMLTTSVTRLRRIAELEGKVAATESQAGAKAKLDAALVAIKEAEGLDAERHAPDALNRAKKALADANAAFAAKDFSGAGRFADLATEGAAQAKATAAPLHAADEAKRVSRDEDDAIFAEARKISVGSVSVTPRGITLVLPDMFEKRETKPTVQAQAEITQVAAIAKKFPKRSLIIEAHTDSTGGKSANLSLSQARADAVLTALTENQIPPSRLTAIGKGQSEPIADNRTKAGRAQNRRVTVIFSRVTE
ncbi:MAG: OmpA family protein [Polyangiales bacterium]|nr:OmpA family protein [Myxococcales bacterium]